MMAEQAQQEIAAFLADASNLAGGHAARVVRPHNIEEVAAALREATRTGMAVTVAGAGTGVVGGRVPFGGIVLATDKLNRIVEIVADETGGHAVVEAGVTLADFRRAVEARGLFYPPDPTEWSCYMGGTVATNASGARTFKYGPTRKYVRRLKVVLATGDTLNLKRGRIHADTGGLLRIPLASGRGITAQLPTYHMPRTRKHVAGYFIAPEMDAIDLFIGSEGTLGVIAEIETTLLAKPAGVLSGVVFFAHETDLLAFVRAAREQSLRTRATASVGALDARALEYFDDEALNFLRAHEPRVPIGAQGALFFEQETNAATEDELLRVWLALCEAHHALLDDSWFAVNEQDQARLREFRHRLPVLVNEWLTRHGQRKVSTDMAVPDEAFAGMLDYYKESLRASRLQYVIFGHIGDNHVHVNILPRDDAEAAQARALYGQFITRAVAHGGTVSAEHGVGKLKRDYLRALYGDAHLREMAALKRAFDPAGILGRGNIIGEELLNF